MFQAASSPVTAVSATVPSLVAVVLWWEGGVL